MPDHFIPQLGVSWGTCGVNFNGLSGHSMFLNTKMHYKKGRFMHCFCSNSFKYDRLIIQGSDQQTATQRQKPLIKDISSTRIKALLHCEMFRATCLEMFCRHCCGTSCTKHFTV